MDMRVGRTPARRAQGTGTRDAARTQAAILRAATQEFTLKGLNGARVDEIAARANVNKRMIYHYFGGKEGLYLAVLEATYAAIRTAEIDLHLETLPPVDGIRRLVDFTWRYFIDHPEFLSLLATENLHQRAKYLRQSRRIRELHSPLVSIISQLLRRGSEEGVFRRGVDPVQLYITIAALGFFYMSNRHTLSTIFGRDLGAPRSLVARGKHIADVVLAYLQPGAGNDTDKPHLTPPAARGHK
jgi:AcrR family transcriptional regulator